MMILHGQALRRGVSRIGGNRLRGSKALRRQDHGAGDSFPDGVAVMARIGLTRQAVNVLGGYSVRERIEDGEHIRRDAAAVARANAFALGLEEISEALARRITEDIAIPTICIGASPACDEPILVVDDMLGSFSGFRLGSIQPRQLEKLVNHRPRALYPGRQSRRAIAK